MWAKPRVQRLVYSYRNRTDLARSRPVQPNHSRCYNSSAEAGILVAITGHGPTPPVGGTYYHQQWASPSHYCTHQGSDTPLTYPAVSHRGASPGNQRLV
ncbi:hypothetical protein AVEN_170432-1 [Araneus ventricosus]|uniref:Uncharacterized protein n=1 Tax=Araneus ventricosus TaxID=182803 RepID=A0A4Y2R249_ARAVE|nr:hypothetical protein AVEN_170432-1 [Araneus ventricosus]